MKLSAALLVAPVAAFAPRAAPKASAVVVYNNGQMGNTDDSYPAFLPGGLGTAGPMPEDSLDGPSIFDGPMGWDREAYSTVFVDPSQLDAAFTSANGAALDAKLEPYDDAEQKKLLDKFGDLELLNMDAKKIDAFINPPPPKKAAKKEPAKKAPKE